jgi:lipid II:glycine glycyltransferase (peptidoglycan interpeptide bridge formation enzyme)
MRKTTRYEIKHAQGVTVEKSKDIERFFALYTATSVRQNFVQHKGIREEFETLDCDLFIASRQGRDLATAIVVYFGDEAIYHHGASVPNKSGASYLLQWHAVREAKRRGMTVYNFWGIAPNAARHHPWQGITLFKTGFGGRQIEFMHAQDYLISPLAVIPRTIENLRKQLKGY